MSIEKDFLMVKEWEGQKLVFEYAMNKDEARYMTTIIKNVMIRHKGPQTSINYVVSCALQIPLLMDALQNFFKSFDNHAKKPMFVRTNHCSPKDAFYQLVDSQNECIDVVTNQTIERDLNVLKIYHPIQVIQVLCHSERIYEAMISNQYTTIQLYEWKTDFYRETETRCFIMEGKLCGISRYYPFAYPSWLDTEKFKDLIVELLTKKLLDGGVRRSFSIDVALTHGMRLFLIEFNDFDDRLDLCLFSHKTLYNEDTIQFLF